MFLLVKNLLNETLKVIARFHAVGNPLEDVVESVPGNFPEDLGVLAAYGFESDNTTFQRDRHDDIQR